MIKDLAKRDASELTFKDKIIINVYDMEEI